jgi:hypothetical protein
VAFDPVIADPLGVSVGVSPPGGTHAWYVRSGRPDRGRWSVRCFLDDRHPDGQVITDPGPLDGLFVLWSAGLDPEGRTRIRVSPAVAPGAPACWFVVLPEKSPAAVTLVAFSSPLVPTGRVIENAEFFHLPVASESQLGAIRWTVNDAVVDQVYVGEEWRRRHLATVLIYTASAFHQHQGWRGRLHSDGRRTVMGELLVTGFRHPERIADLEHLMDPMDPREGAAP